MAFQSPRKSSRVASSHTPNDVADDKDATDDIDVPKDKDVPDDKDVAHDEDTADDKDAGDDATIIPCDENVNELPDDAQKKEKTHEPPKKKRGRPKKDASKSVAPKSVMFASEPLVEDETISDGNNDDDDETHELPKKKRGRPKKVASKSAAPKSVAPKSVAPKKIVPVSTKKTTDNGLLSKSFKSLENDLELLQGVIASTSDASIARERVKTFKTKFDALFASTDDSLPVVKKKRGRPKKVDTIEPVQKKKRGRPPKDKTLDIIPKKPRGRPPKQAKQ